MTKAIFLILYLSFSFTSVFGQKYVSLVKVQKNGKFGFLNDEAKEVIPCEFDLLHDFSEGLVAGKKEIIGHIIIS